jgi:hypothetical protein
MPHKLILAQVAAVGVLIVCLFLHIQVQLFFFGAKIFASTNLIYTYVFFV